MARGLVFNDYNSLQYGEPDLQNALSHNLSLLYSSFNLFNYTNVFARASYSNNIDQIRGLTNFENVIRTSTFFNSNFADENFNIFGDYNVDSGSYFYKALGIVDREFILKKGSSIVWSGNPYRSLYCF